MKAAISSVPLLLAEVPGKAQPQASETPTWASVPSQTWLLACLDACRRGVQLHILSPGMEKRRTNSTR